MGRHATPPELAARRGNPGECKLPEAQVVLPLAVENVPKPPEGLGDAGRAYWGDVWRAAATWLSLELNGTQVEAVARRYDEIARYSDALKAAGPLVRVPKVAATGRQVVDPNTGQPVYEFVQNPAEQMLRRAERLQLADLIALGAVNDRSGHQVPDEPYGSGPSLNLSPIGRKDPSVKLLSR